MCRRIHRKNKFYCELVNVLKFKNEQNVSFLTIIHPECVKWALIIKCLAITEFMWLIAQPCTPCLSFIWFSKIFLSKVYILFFPLFLFIYFYFLFSFINNTRGLHCNHSTDVYSIFWTSSVPLWNSLSHFVMPSSFYLAIYLYSLSIYSEVLSYLL
jgi:hypothetical protein